MYNYVSTYIVIQTFAGQSSEEHNSELKAYKH